MVSPEKLVEMLEPDSIYFSATGGGATFGGGESMLHAAFIRAFREVCPADWRIAVETSLNVEPENVRACLDCVDEWIVDIKDMNPEIYASYTGAGTEKRDVNLRMIAEKCPQKTHIRVPRIPNFNLDSDVSRSERVLLKMGFERIDRFEYIEPASRHLTLISLSRAGEAAISSSTSYEDSSKPSCLKGISPEKTKPGCAKA